MTSSQDILKDLTGLYQARAELIGHLKVALGETVGTDSHIEYERMYLAECERNKVLKKDIDKLKGEKE